MMRMASRTSPGASGALTTVRGDRPTSASLHGGAEQGLESVDE